MGGNWQKQKLIWYLTLNKQWNWSSCTESSLIARGTNGLIGQSFRAFEWNSVVAGSSPTQTNFFLSMSKYPSAVYIICISSFRYTYIIISTGSIKIIVATDKSISRNKLWHWINDEIGVAVKNGSECMVNSWTLVQSVRPSDWNSVVMDSNSPLANVREVLQRIL